MRLLDMSWRGAYPMVVTMPWQPREQRAVAAVIPLNLALFVLVASLPAFRAAHHHWIFPLLAALLAGQWLLTFALEDGHPSLDPRTLRASVLAALLFLVVMGIVRHATILACFDLCGFKLAAAAAIAAPVFWGQSRLQDGRWWSPSRSSLAALGSALWALYLSLRGLQLSPWALDAVFLAFALLLWLGRSRADFLLASLGIVSGIAIRATGNEYAIIGLGAVWGVALPLVAVPHVEVWLRRRARSRAAAEAARADASPARRFLLSGARIAATVAVAAALGVFLIGPVFLMSDRSERRERLARTSPKSPIQDPKTLSPLAARLRAHVVMLARTIGERDAFQPAKQARARDYILGRFASFGYAPKKRAYQSRWLPSIKNDTDFFNVEAVLAVAPADVGAAWIVGAHYDSASGTPGADDNASAVAVLLEAARLLKARKPSREVRFVAFGTEEPPSFGTRNMGSAHYARRLKDDGVRVHGMISLEMLGYYNPRKGSQLYPPFLHLLYPDHGDYVSVTSDWESRRLLARFTGAWRAKSSFPLESVVLPGASSGLALSDQLNFWDQGYPALMLSDTAFYRNPNYHEAGDTPDTLDYEKMAEVTRALVMVLGSRGGG